MSGKFSRDKGSREERALVYELNKLGYQNVRRVPLSGASKGFKFDVLAEEGANGAGPISFELKTRRCSYGWVYGLLQGAEVVRLAAPGLGCVSLGYDPRAVGEVGFNSPFAANAVPEKTLKRLFKLQELKQGADYLVLKDNRKRRVYLKFWGQT